MDGAGKGRTTGTHCSQQRWSGETRRRRRREGSAAADAAAAEWADYSALLAGGEDNVDAILSEQQRVFGSILDKLGGDKELKLQHNSPDAMSLDIAFVVDATGSMSAWLEAVKANIRSIAADVAPRIARQYPELKLALRLALLAYRDVGEAAAGQQFQQLDFTEDAAALQAQLAGVRAFGGGDGPEDVLGALDRAATQLSWASKARFIVLIADAPAHGRECNDDPGDAYPNGVPGGPSLAQVMDKLKDERRPIDLMLCKVRNHALTKMEAAMRKHYDSRRANRSLRSVQLFDDSKMPATRFHLVFCLDESGSMAGSKWADVLSAYNQMLGRRRADQGLGDLVTVVTFSDYAQTQCALTPIDNAPSSFSFSGRGTNFAPALHAAESAMQRQPADCVPLLLFLSDGANADPGPTDAAMARIVAAYGGRTNLQVHTIGFQAGGGEAMLRHMAAAAPGGRFHSCQSGVDLASAFTSIAAGCSAVDGLVQRFAEILSEQISIKIMHDYL